MMEIRQAVHPEHAAMMPTDELREHFLVEGLSHRARSSWSTAITIV